jgi:PAS domain S-box-containing protein
VDLSALGWFCLTGFIISLGTVFLYLYKKSYDTKKLMLGIGILPCSLTFSFYAVNIVLETESGLLTNQLFFWGAFPFFECIFFILIHQVFCKTKNFSGFFKWFVFFFLLSFVLSLSRLITEQIFVFFMQLSAVLIIGLSLILIFRDRNLTSFLFLFSMVSFFIGGITFRSQVHGGGELFSTPLLAYFMSYIYLGLLAGIPFTEPKQQGIGSYFSLQKKLQITEAALRESEQRYRSIVENSRDMIMLTRPDGSIAYVSPATEMVIGYRPEDLVETIPWIIHPDDLESVQAVFSKALHGESHSNYQYRIKTKSGEIRWVSHSWSPIMRDNKVDLVVSTVRDITEIKNINQQLSEKVSSLEKNERATLNIMEDLQETITDLKKTKQEIFRLNQQLEQKVSDRTKEIQQLLKQKDDFINQLGHDLRTPLTPLTTLLPIIQKHVDDPKIKELLDVALKNLEYMKNLVIRTLELAQLNSSHLPLMVEDINLLDEVNKMVNLRKILFDKNEVKIQTIVPEKIKVQADQLRLEEVFDNLFINALKYTPCGGTITVNAIQQNDSVTVSVSDNGIGMTPEQLQHIFQEFYKGDSSRHNLESTGLGLSICKRIVEKHGGRIWAESQGPGKGTTFYFTMKTPQQAQYQ